MTKASPPPGVSSSQFNSASLHVDSDTTVADTEAEATAAAPPTELPPPPSTEDPHDECVLCCYPFPFIPEESVYHACCGELICNGCISAQARTLVIGTNIKKPIKGSKEEELEFTKILCSNSSEVPILCPFCRAKKPTNSQERLKRLWERIDEYKDPRAMNMLGSFYVKGECGLTENLKKAEELYQQAYDLGDDIAAFNLSLQTSDKARIVSYLEEGVKRGNAHCMNALAIRAAKAGNQEEAKRQFMTAARSGQVGAMKNLMINYREEPGSVISKDDIATTLRAHKAFHDKRKTEPREYAMRHNEFRLKMVSTGQMKAFDYERRTLVAE